jgi:hypothetical protein
MLSKNLQLFIVVCPAECRRKRVDLGCASALARAQITTFPRAALVSVACALVSRCLFPPGARRLNPGASWAGWTLGPKKLRRSDMAVLVPRTGQRLASIAMRLGSWPQTPMLHVLAENQCCGLRAGLRGPGMVDTLAWGGEKGESGGECCSGQKSPAADGQPSP